MKLSNTTLAAVRRFVKRLDSALWLWLERLAKAVLARSYQHVTLAARHRVVHSEAYRKGAVVPSVRAWHSTADRN